ncbi:hypothetical protein YBT020_23740 [Bacillus thuringiensis serovar finitimus YBT-020]|nr:hypothetical protein YBT020_23740 [Bacillus thuringiensis serovar finitimus YBT-020]
MVKLNANAVVAHVMTIHVCVEVNATRIRVNAVIRVEMRLIRKTPSLMMVFYFSGL